MIAEKIKELYPSGGFIGGNIRLIVGPIGIVFEMIHHPSLDKIQRHYKENDELPIVKIKDNKLYVVPFFSEIPILLDGRFKGIRYLTNK